MENSHDVVEIIAIHRQRRVSAATDVLEKRAPGLLGGDRHQFGARDHDLAGGHVREPEHPVEHLLFLLLEHAGFLAGGHEHLQLFF